MNLSPVRTGLGLTAALTVLAPISWGTTYVTVTELLPDGRPLTVAAARVVPAGLVLVLHGIATSRWRPRGVEWGHIGALALCNFGVFFPLLIVAVYRLPGGVAAAVGGLQPLLVAGFTWVVARHRPRPVDVAVGVAAAVGVTFVVIRPGAGIDPVGIVAAVGANISFSLGVVLTKRFPTSARRVTATGWQLLASALILVPLALVIEGRPPNVGAIDIAGFTYLSLIATGAAFVLWFAGIGRLPAAAPPLLGLAAPLTGATVGWILLDQALAATQLAGFAVTIAAIAYGASLREGTERPVAPEPRPEPGSGGRQQILEPSTSFR